MSPRRKLLVAIGIGMVLAGPPVAALNIWLGGMVERQAREELALTARRHMTLVEARIAKTVTTIEELAARGIDACRTSFVDALRQATFGTTPVKELSIVAADGRTLCTDVGSQLDQRKVISSEPLSVGSPMLLEVVRLSAQSEQWVRIRRPGAGGGNGIAALIPGPLFVPQVSTAGGPLSVHAIIGTTGGTQIAEAGTVETAADQGDLLISELSSARYPLKTTISSTVGRTCRQSKRSTGAWQGCQWPHRHRHPGAYGAAAAA